MIPQDITPNVLTINLASTDIDHLTQDLLGQKETFGRDGCVHGIGCGDGIMGVYLYPNSSSCTHVICTALCISVISQSWGGGCLFCLFLGVFFFKDIDQL